MIIQTTETWDEHFFIQFTDFKNQLFKNDPNIFNESLEDLKVFFKKESPVTKEYYWKAFLVIDQSHVLARGVLSFKQNSTIGQVGFLEFSERKDAAELLFQAIEAESKKLGLNELRGPVNINFFISYRWKLPNGGAPFYTEPVVPNYYHDYIKQSGFNISETWDTFKIDFKAANKRWKEKQNSIKKKPSGKYNKIVIKHLWPWNFEKDLIIIHRLFVESYKQMGEYEEISFESFKILYKNFKYLVNPFFSYIAYFEDEPIGFVINIFDSLPILRRFAKKAPTSTEKVSLIAKLATNKDRLLIMY